MTVKINADTTNGAVITSDTSGEIELQSGGTKIATVKSTGLEMASGKDLNPRVPAFQARRSGTSQSITASTWTKLQYQTEVFDTHSLYDNATNYRFTPDVAGYYHINLGARADGTNKAVMTISIYKNGVAYSYSNRRYASSGAEYLAHSTVLYLDGVDDYVEGYINITGATNATVAPVAQASALSGYLVSI